MLQISKFFRCLSHGLILAKTIQIVQISEESCSFRSFFGLLNQELATLLHHYHIDSFISNIRGKISPDICNSRRFEKASTPTCLPQLVNSLVSVLGDHGFEAGCEVVENVDGW